MFRLLALALAALLLGATAQAQTPVERHGRLQVSGTHIVDQAGKPVTLRGMSLFWSQWQPQYYNAATIKRLRDDWKITVIRAAMAVDSGGYRANPDAEMAKVETVIDAAVANGIYVIVDWHAHKPHAKEAAAFFARIAAKYGALPNLIYEPYNEPLATHAWKTLLKPYHQTVLASIRAADPDNLVVVGTRTWSQDVDEAAADPIADPNLAYTLHYYAATHKQELRDKAALAMQRGAALFVTEYGVTQADGGSSIDEAEARRWWDFLEASGISYANWSIADKDELSAAFRPGTPGDGTWTEDQVTRSGKLVRDQIRAMNAD
ncbi:glycoside hydrolase family 5 protein [Sphingomonas japonica]|uniref:Endoglucanase n=2 Tax=Sphingomonas japonica TaxID=511662 RepID=A0ABX0TW86_9SPHN|nr:glycoside hydrolase family 5 protein [Sphingomonas japonica]NIJ22584.1 endoglucanase [Sphingomonas japonica]